MEGSPPRQHGENAGSTVLLFVVDVCCRRVGWRVIDGVFVVGELAGVFIVDELAGVFIVDELAGV